MGKMMVEEIIKNFAIDGELKGYSAFGSGHINDTYRLQYEMSDGSVKKFTLQKVNTNVFKDIYGLINNISLVTHHIRKKLRAEGKDPERGTLRVVPTVDNKPFYRDEDGNCFRVFVHICEARTFQTVENEEQFEHLAEIFGNFQNQLADFDASKLVETIPDFHNTAKRFEALEKAIDDDAAGRASSVASEISFALERKSDASVLVELLEKGELPLRVTHNDTKLDNVLFDEKTLEAICVIDLDTVMPGLVHYDFGDSIRFGASTAAEDEKDLSKVEMDIGLFEAYTRGFLRACGDKLTEKEIEYLPFSAKLITYECGIRFLTDYLNGDVYFKTHYEGQNLDRCRTQFKLVADMEKKMPQMKEIVKKLSGK